MLKEKGQIKPIIIKNATDDNGDFLHNWEDMTSIELEPFWFPYLIPSCTRDNVRKHTNAVEQPMLLTDNKLWFQRY
jgi:hypothetical protein